MLNQGGSVAIAVIGAFTSPRDTSHHGLIYAILGVDRDSVM